MKKKSLILAFLVATLCFCGCEKTSPDFNSLPSLPDLKDVDDVCTKMTDTDFITYCYENFDFDQDGKVSMSEANVVTTISCSSAEDFAGIEYFSNLESFESHSARYLDLRYNTQLTSIYCSSSPVEKLDLRYCTNMTELGEYAFSNCSRLTSIEFPSSLTSIGGYAFYCCSGLTYLDLPSNLTKIGYNAFYKCTSLDTVISRATIPPTLSCSYTNVGLGVHTPFYGCSSLYYLYIPSESIQAYHDSYWLFVEFHIVDGIL